MPCSEESSASSGSIVGNGEQPPSDADAVISGGSCKKIRFTDKVRRGLALVVVSLEIAGRDDLPPLESVTKKWTKARLAEYDAALNWLIQEANSEKITEDMKR